MSPDRRAAAALAALLLAGCGNGLPPRDGPAFGEVRATFLVARDDQVIRVESLGPQAIATATLVLPDGTRDPAYSIDTIRDPSRTDTQMQTIPDNDSPIGPAAATGAYHETTTMIGQIASLALIRVGYPADYAQGWRKATIEVRLGFGPDGETRTLAAPPPPG